MLGGAWPISVAGAGGRGRSSRMAGGTDRADLSHFLRKGVFRYRPEAVIFCWRVQNHWKQKSTRKRNRVCCGETLSTAQRHAGPHNGVLRVAAGDGPTGAIHPRDGMRPGRGEGGG